MSWPLPGALHAARFRALRTRRFVGGILLARFRVVLALRRTDPYPAIAREEAVWCLSALSFFAREVRFLA